MKNRIYIVLLLVFLGCTGENAPDCFQTTGDIVQQEISVADFNTITVFENIELILKEGKKKVIIETGENLIGEVTAVVEGNRLILRDENNCNFVRDYGVTKMYVSAPNITEIRSSTSWPIRSDGVLSYPNLFLFSEDFGVPEASTTDGEFLLEVHTNSLSIIVNGNSYFKLSGETENFNVTIASGDTRIEAQTLMATNGTFNHRGSNDLLIYPLETLTGVLRGTGDVQSFNTPASISVETLYTGELRFVN